MLSEGKCMENIGIIEGHMHILFEMAADETVNIINEYMCQLRYEKIALLSLPYVTKSEEELLTQNLNTKHMHLGR